MLVDSVREKSAATLRLQRAAQSETGPAPARVSEPAADSVQLSPEALTALNKTGPGEEAPSSNMPKEFGATYTKQGHTR